MPISATTIMARAERRPARSLARDALADPDDVDPHTRDAVNRLTADEIAIARRGDADWCLPPWARDRRQRMAEAEQHMRDLARRDPAPADPPVAAPTPQPE